jgi:hypothetical protein
MSVGPYAGAQEPQAARPIGEQQVPETKEELKAVEVARAALGRKLFVSPDTLPVMSIEPRRWPDSGLGCATPDTAIIRLPNRGHVVVLATPTGTRRVHVSGRRALICDQPEQAHTVPVVQPQTAPTEPPPANLSVQVERARADLAGYFRVPVSDVRLVTFTPATWPDSTMDCAVPYEQIKNKAVKGYQLQLWHGERMFVYHTDLARTRACPAIDMQYRKYQKSSAQQTAKPVGKQPDKS